MKKMEKNEILNAAIGKDKPQLSIKQVVVVEIEWETVTIEGKVIGQKVILKCNHPDSKESINISGIKYIANKRLKLSGLWLNFDEEGLLQGRSAVARMLRHYGKNNLLELKGLALNTEFDDGGYLVIKAY